MTEVIEAEMEKVEVVEAVVEKVEKCERYTHHIKYEFVRDLSKNLRIMIQFHICESFLVYIISKELTFPLFNDIEI